MRADADILRETLAGKREAFSELVERHYPLVYGLALSSLRNRNDAEDAAQETFLRALKSLNTLKEPARFASWLSSIVRNICRDLRARQSTEQHVAHLAAESSHEASVPDGNDLHELLWDHVMALAPDEREILILYYFSKHNTRAIAELLTISVPAAEKRLQRARQSLGTRMEVALNETMESRGPSTRGVEKTVQVVIAAPVLWKPVVSGGLIGATGSAATVVGSWKAIAVLSGLIALSISIPLALTARPSVERSHEVPEEVTEKPVATEEVGGVSESSVIETSAPPRVLVTNVQDDRPGVLVVDAAKQTPIQGVQVTLITQKKALHITTDMNGIARFDVSPSEGVRMKLLHENYLPRKDVPVAFNSNSLQTIALDQPGRVRGRVVDAKTRAAVTDYKIYIRGKYGEIAPNWQRDPKRHIQDSSGRFEAKGVTKGAVTVTAFGYASAFTHMDAADAEVEIALEPDYTLDITVSDGTGRPIENVDILTSVKFSSTGEDFDKESGRTKGGTTDSNGKAFIEHLLAKPYDIAIRDPRFFPMNYTIDQSLEGPVIPVSLVVNQAGGVEGVVRYGDAPASDVTVSLSLGGLDGAYKLQRYFVTQTASDGAFRVDSLPSGLYNYKAQVSEEYAWNPIDMPLIAGELTVTPGAITRHDIAVPIGTASISGRVSLGSAPLADVHVNIGTESGGQTYFRSTRTDNDGRYAIDGLLPGPASIYFMHSITFDAVRTEDRVDQLFRRHHPVDLAAGSNTALDVQFLTGTQLIASIIAPDDARSSLDIIRTPRDTAAPKSLRNFAAEAECFGSRELRFESLDAGTYEISIRMFSNTLGNRHGSVSVEIPSSGAAEIELNWESLQPSQ